MKLESFSKLNSDLFFSKYSSEKKVMQIKISCAIKSCLNAKKGTSNTINKTENPKLMLNFSKSLRFFKRPAMAKPGIKDINIIIII